MKLSEIYSDPTVDVNDLVWSFDWIKPKKIIAVDTMPGLPGLHVIDGDDPKAQYLASLYQAFDGQKVRITSNTSDGAVMVVQVTSDKNPGDFYLFNGKTSKADYLFSSKPEIDPKLMADMRPIAFQARDGLTIHGYLTLPQGSAGKNLPLINQPPWRTSRYPRPVGLGPGDPVLRQSRLCGVAGELPGFRRLRDEIPGCGLRPLGRQHAG